MRAIGSPYSPVPAEVLRDIAGRRRHGDSLRVIAAALTAAGIPTATGLHEWTATSVRSALLSRRGQAAIAGDECEPPTRDGEPTRIGLALLRARVAAGLTTRATGAAAGVSATTVERLESGRGTPSPVNLAAVLVALDMPPTEVAGLIEDGGLRVAVLRAMAAAEMDEESLLHAA